MGNFFFKKAAMSMLGLTSDQWNAIMEMASSFQSNEINQETVFSVFEKLSQKTPQEINDLLEDLNQRL